MRAPTQLLLMLGAAAIIIACEDAGAPIEETCPESGARLCFTTPDTVIAVIAAVNDIGDRSTLGLTTGGPRSQIQSLVHPMMDALAAGRVTAARDALADM